MQAPVDTVLRADQYCTFLSEYEETAIVMRQEDTTK